VFKYVIGWIAYGFQHPAERAEVALVAIGLKGSGKGTLGWALHRIYSPHALYIDSSAGIVERFNEDFKAATFLMVDEACWTGNQTAAGKLQSIITERSLRVEPKYIGRYQVPNTLKVIMLAEKGNWVVPAGPFERRYAVLDVSDAMVKNADYFGALCDEIEGGGVEAMFWDLRRVDLAQFKPRHLPEALSRSKALQLQQQRTLSPIERWWETLLHEGMLPGARPTPRCKLGTVGTGSLMADVAARFPRLARDLDYKGLSEFLVAQGAKPDHFPWGNGYQLPPLEECRQAWIRRFPGIGWQRTILGVDGSPGDWEWTPPKPDPLDVG
jgi:Family of unknown function (DUF5906)